MITVGIRGQELLQCEGSHFGKPNPQDPNRADLGREVNAQIRDPEAPKPLN